LKNEGRSEDLGLGKKGFQRNELGFDWGRKTKVFDRIK